MSLRIAAIESQASPTGKGAKPGATLTSLLFPATLVVSVLVAYLLVDGQWQIAVLLISFLPGILILHRFPFLTVTIWMLAMPFLVQSSTAAERQLYWMVHRALPPLAVGTILVASLSRFDRRPLPRLGVPEFAMAGYLVLTLLSIQLQNDDPLATTILFYDRVIVPMLLYLVIRLSPLTDKEMKWLVAAALFISISQSLIGILSWIAPQTLPAPWLDKAGSRTVGSLVNAGVYTSTLTFSGLLVLHAALNSKPGLLPNLFKLAFLLCAYSIFASFSRASWIAGILVVLGLLYLYPKYTVRLGVIVGIPLLLLGGVVLASQLQWAGERLYSQEAERSALSRLPVFYAAYRMFEEKPIFGWGYGTFDQYDRQFYDNVMGLPSDDKDHASHNLYLTIIAEQGILGLLLFLGPFLAWLVVTLKRLPNTPKGGFWSRKLLIILWLVVFSHIIVNNFQNMLVVFGLGMWWITLAMIATLVDSYRSPGYNPTQGVRSLPSLGA